MPTLSYLKSEFKDQSSPLFTDTLASHLQNNASLGGGGGGGGGYKPLRVDPDYKIMS